MDDSRTYTIIIKDETSEKRRTTASPASTEEKQSDGLTLEQIKKLAPVGFAVGAFKKVVSNEINKVELRTGQSELQQRLQFNYSVASGVVGLGLTAMAGAKIGGAIGAVVAVGFSLANTSMDLINKQQTINLQRQNEVINRQLMLNRMGSGYRYNGGGLR